MRAVNIFFGLLLAPLIGLVIALVIMTGAFNALAIPLNEVNAYVSVMEDDYLELQEGANALTDAANDQESEYQAQQETMENLSNQINKHKNMSDKIYDDKILAMLGPPVKEFYSKRVEIKVFKLAELGYRGYIAKLKLYDPTAFKVVLGKDKLGERETTSEAVKRTGAMLGINAGGFYTETRDGKPYGIHLGTTIIDGKIIGEFNPYPPDMFFAGIDRRGNLIGGLYGDRFAKEKNLMKLQPWQGVTFVPILIQNGKKLPIPAKWKTTNQPRTIIGEYANGDLILIVVDGRRYNWSSGVTLERLQDKLLELGVKEGYNLDGGGSTSMVFNGEVLNKPSDGKERPVVTNIVVMP